VLGVDLSREMIALAGVEESRVPLGIDYRVADVRNMNSDEQFDLVFAAYLLNYARKPEELMQMCRTVVNCLKPGGRFVTVNNNPAEPVANFVAGTTYGYSKRVEGQLVEGAPIIWRFLLPEGSFEVRNYYLTIKTMDDAFWEAGLYDVQWHRPEVSAEGICAFGKEHWSAFLANPPVVFITATIGNSRQ
jgi:2-polyprenyl-3-methyl-5-hydroxy-6-metoxy-1,4-benzoquinol methylase